MGSMVSGRPVGVARDNLDEPSPITFERGDTHGRSVRPSLYTNAGNHPALTASLMVLVGLGAAASVRRRQLRWVAKPR